MKLGHSGTVGHVPDSLVHVLAPILGSGDIAHMRGTINGVPRPAPEGVWVPGGKIEILCEYRYVMYGVKKDHSSIQRRLRYTQKSWKLPRTKD